MSKIYHLFQPSPWGEGGTIVDRDGWGVMEFHQTFSTSSPPAAELPLKGKPCQFSANLPVPLCKENFQRNWQRLLPAVWKQFSWKSFIKIKTYWIFYYDSDIMIMPHNFILWYDAMCFLSFDKKHRLFSAYALYQKLCGATEPSVFLCVASAAHFLLSGELKWVFRKTWKPHAKVKVWHSNSSPIFWSLTDPQLLITKKVRQCLTQEIYKNFVIF